VHNREESSILHPVATGSIDLAKYVLQRSAVEAPAKGVGRQQLSRSALSHPGDSVLCHVGIPLQTALPTRITRRVRADPPG
jgi:hypothetical protein